MRKKSSLSLAFLLAVGVVIILILPVWALSHAAHDSNTVQTPTTPPLHSTGTLTLIAPSTSTSISLTPSPIVTTTVLPPRPHPSVTITYTPTSTASTAKLYLSALSDYGRLYYGLQMQLIGSQFVPGESVRLVWEYQQPSPYNLGTATVASNGGFDFETKAPSDPDLNQVNIAAFGMQSKRWAMISMPVIPVLYANPYIAPIGTRINALGGGFKSEEHVTLLFNGTVSGIGIADSRGAFTINFMIPTSTQAGVVSLQAVGQSSGIKVSASYLYVY